MKKVFQNYTDMDPQIFAAWLEDLMNKGKNRSTDKAKPADLQFTKVK